MGKSHFKISVFFLVSLLFVVGCATTRARRPEAATTDLQNQVTQLQSEIQAKDQQIQELQYQLQGSQSALQNTSASSTGTKASKSSLVRVPGISVEDVQRALARAGFDPGPVDGRMGTKTKSALKDFQRKNNLKADGIVGERTWSYLRS